MPTRQELLIEANRRGILPPDQKKLFDEAVNRGLIILPTPGQALTLPDPSQQIPVQFIPGPETREIAGRTFLEAGGATVGSVLGGGPTPLGVAGGSLGFAAGRELGDIVFGEDVGTLGEELTEAGENVLEGAKAELFGLIGGRILTATGRKLMDAPKFASEQIKRIRSAQQAGIPVTLGEASQVPFLRKGENFFRKLITPSGKIAKFDQKRITGLIREFDRMEQNLLGGRVTPEKEAALMSFARRIQNEVDTLLAGKVQARGRVLNKIRDEVLEKFGSNRTFSELGQTAKEAIETRRREFTKVSGGFFEKAKNILPNKGNEIIPVPKTAKNISSAIQEEGKALSVTGSRNIKLLQSIADDFPGEGITFDQLMRRRSDINDIIARVESTTGLPGEQQLITAGKKTSRLFRSIKAAMDDDLEFFASRKGRLSSAVDNVAFPRVKSLIDEGINESRKGFQFAKIPSIKKALKAQPEDVAEILLKAGPSGTVRVITEFSAKDRIPLQKAVINNILGGNLDEAATGTGILSRIKQAGEGTLRPLIGDTNTEELIDLGLKMRTIERGAAKIQTTGLPAKDLGLSPVNILENRFWKQLVFSKKPSQVVDLIILPNQPENIKRTYGALRAAGRSDLVQDIKVETIRRIFPPGPLNTKQIVNNADKITTPTLKAALSESEFEALDNFLDIVRLVNINEATEAQFELIRVFGEPIGFSLSPLFFKDKSKTLLKQFARLSKLADTAALRKQRNTIMSKLIAIGIQGEADRNKKEAQR